MIDDVTRRRMYSTENNDMKKFVKKVHEVKEAKESKDTVLFEMAGRKHRVPTFSAYSRLLEEHKTTQNDLQKAQSDIKKLSETIKRLDGALKIVEIGLDGKADIYGD